MADASVGVKESPNPDRPIDNESVTGHPAGTAYRQRVEVTGAALAEVANVKNAKPAANAYGLVVRDPERPIDAVSAALVTIPFEHHEAHEGSSFMADLADTSMANGETLILAFKTDATADLRAHVLVSFTTLVGGDLAVFEAPTWTAETGSLVPILNRKREASMGSSTLLEDQAQAAFTASDNLVGNPTGLAGGTLLRRTWAWGRQATIGAGGERGTKEIILKPGTAYAVVFTAAGASNTCQVCLDWYEHTDSA